MLGKFLLSGVFLHLYTFLGSSLLEPCAFMLGMMFCYYYYCHCAPLVLCCLLCDAALRGVLGGREEGGTKEDWNWGLGLW